MAQREGVAAAQCCHPTQFIEFNSQVRPLYKWCQTGGLQYLLLLLQGWFLTIKIAIGCHVSCQAASPVPAEVWEALPAMVLFLRCQHFVQRHLSRLDNSYRALSDMLRSNEKGVKCVVSPEHFGIETTECSRKESLGHNPGKGIASMLHHRIGATSPA